MTKAERRKRARARAREREQAAVAPDALEQAIEEVKAEPAPTQVEPESEFITGPVRARPAPRMAATRLDLPGRVQAPLDEDDEGDGEDDDEEVDEDDLIEGADEGGDDEDEDEDLEEQEDALFNLACAAVEQGDALSWQEAAALLLTAEVLDPRLALVVALLMEGAPESETADKHVPLPLTGERVLRLLAELGLGDLVDEAREVTSLAPGEEGGSERELVRTSARELNELSKRELAEGKKGERGKKASARPLRASEVGSPKTILSSGATQRRPG